MLGARDASVGVQGDSTVERPRLGVGGEETEEERFGLETGKGAAEFVVRRRARFEGGHDVVGDVVDGGGRVGVDGGVAHGADAKDARGVTLREVGKGELESDDDGGRDAEPKRRTGETALFERRTHVFAANHRNGV